MWRAACLAISWLLLPAGARAQACQDDSALSYVCGPEKPEDVLAIPGTRWLVASGFADGAGLKLVDTRTRGYARWFDGSPGQVAFDRRAYPQCPGPVDPALFNARVGTPFPMCVVSWEQFLMGVPLPMHVMSQIPFFLGALLTTAMCTQLLFNRHF